MNGWRHPFPEDWHYAVERSLEEDLGPGDLSAGCFKPDQTCRATLEFQAEGTACGMGIFYELFSEQAEVEIRKQDGDAVKIGTIAAIVEGPTAYILSRERPALNFVMQLSGVSTLTRKFVDTVKGTNAKIVDTRKTTPGLRSLQKYAVRCGGGTNHRLGLYDAAMIKDNHIQAAGSISKAIKTLRSTIPHTAKIEVECSKLEQISEAIEQGADIILLDNMTSEMISKVMESYANQAVFEASGGINLDTVRAIAETGVNLISVGALTHSASSLSVHLEVD